MHCVAVDKFVTGRRLSLYIALTGGASIERDCWTFKPMTERILELENEFALDKSSFDLLLNKSHIRGQNFVFKVFALEDKPIRFPQNESIRLSASLHISVSSTHSSNKYFLLLYATSYYKMIVKLLYFDATFPFFGTCSKPQSTFSTRPWSQSPPRARLEQSLKGRKGEQVKRKDACWKHLIHEIFVCFSMG